MLLHSLMTATGTTGEKVLRTDTQNMYVHAYMGQQLLRTGQHTLDALGATLCRILHCISHWLVLDHHTTWCRSRVAANKSWTPLPARRSGNPARCTSQPCQGFPSCSSRQPTLTTTASTNARAAVVSAAEAYAAKVAQFLLTCAQHDNLLRAAATSVPATRPCTCAGISSACNHNRRCLRQP
jgi:hypothetical protein